MRVIELRRAVAHGLWTGGLLLLPLVPLSMWLGSQVEGSVVEPRRFSGGAAFLLVAWGLPMVVSLMLTGYLLRPPKGPWLHTCLSTPFRFAVAGTLWLLGMLCLLGVLVLLVVYMLGLASPPAVLILRRNQLVLNVLLPHAPILTVGTLFLFAARKWIRETAPRKR